MAIIINNHYLSVMAAGIDPWQIQLSLLKGIRLVLKLEGSVGPGTQTDYSDWSERFLSGGSDSSEKYYSFPLHSLLTKGGKGCPFGCIWSLPLRLFRLAHDLPSSAFLCNRSVSSSNSLNWLWLLGMSWSGHWRTLWRERKVARQVCASRRQFSSATHTGCSSVSVSTEYPCFSAVNSTVEMYEGRAKRDHPVH